MAFAVAQLSFFVNTTGIVIPFVLTDPPLSAGTLGTPVSNAVSMVVTWMNQMDTARLLVLSNSVSAVFTYTISNGDTRSPREELGYLQISVGTIRYFTSTFLMNIVPHF